MIRSTTSSGKSSSDASRFLVGTDTDTDTGDGDGDGGDVDLGCSDCTGCIGRSNATRLRCVRCSGDDDDGEGDVSSTSTLPAAALMARSARCVLQRWRRLGSSVRYRTGMIFSVRQIKAVGLNKNIGCGLVGGGGGAVKWRRLTSVAN